MSRLIPFFKKHGVNLVLFFIFLIFILPNALVNFSHEGEKLSVHEYQLTGSGQVISFPDQKRNMLIFWATWCGPCHLEMDRLKKSVESGEIKRDQIYALSPFETRSDVERFLKSNPYPFQFIHGHSPLEIKQTPTTLLLEGDRIDSMKSGMSLIGIFLAEEFLKN